MIIKETNFYQYNLPLKKPLNLKGIDCKKREGCIVEIISDQGIIGLGEIAPLPGFSKETLVESVEQAIKLRELLINKNIPEKISLEQADCSEFLEMQQLFSSVRFGFELAILNLLAESKKILLKDIIATDTQNEIPVQALIPGNIKNIQEHVQKLLDSGFREFKLKAAEDIELVLNNVQQIDRVIKSKALLHIDVNQKWDLIKALKFAENVELTAISYIEEPFSNIDDSPEFFEKSLIPIALDESLLDYDLKRISSVEGVEILILKPMLLGGIEKTFTLMKESLRLGIRTVISSSFESELGITALAQLACCQKHQQVAGLDTLKWMDQVIFKDSITIEDGKIDTSRTLMNQQNICYDRLAKIKL